MQRRGRLRQIRGSMQREDGMIQTEEIRLKSRVRSWARPAVAAVAIALAAAACGGDDGKAGTAGGAKAGDPPGQPKGAQAQQPQGQAPAAPPQRTAYGKTAAESQQCFRRLQSRLDSAAAAQKADSTAAAPKAGHSPVFAKEKGWYPTKEQFRDGDLLPCNRIVAYYGNPTSTRMGALGEFPRDEMLRRLQNEVPGGPRPTRARR